MIDGKAAVMIGSSLAGAIAVWAAVYGWGKWLNRPRPASRPDVLGPGALERIECSLDAMAIEIERLGENQRFVTKMLADRDRLQRADVLPPSSPPRVITPH